MRRQIFCLLSIVCVCALAHAQGPLRLVITSPTATLDQSGSPVQLHAYEAFLRGNGFRADVTNNVVWSSSDSSIASIDSTGLVTPGANLGSVVIYARTISGPAASGTITVAVA